MESTSQWDHRAPEKRHKTRIASNSCPSFSRSLFHGKILSNCITPFPTLNQEDLETQSLIRQTLEKFGPKIDSQRIDDEKRLPIELLKELAAAGFFGLLIPEQYGGLGLSNSSYVQVMSAMGIIDASLVVTLGCHQSIGLKALLLFGNETQKRKYLPKLASGEMIAAFALTEPGAGSDAQGIRTTAELTPDGKHFVLNGNKIWITNGGIADFFTVFAKTHVRLHSGEMKERITALIVTRNMPGFSSGSEEKKMGLLGSSTTSLHFDNIQVPIENVIGVVGSGFKIAMEVLNNGRLGLATACAVGSRQLIQRAIDHALHRKQFGRPLAEFGLIQSKIAELAIDAFAAESMCRVAAHLMDEGKYDYALETAMCKYFCTEFEWRTINETIQIAGGTGYMKEYGYEKILRDSRIFSIWEGANEVLRLFVGLSGIQGPGEHLQEVYSALRSPFQDVFHSLELLGDFGMTWIRRRVGTTDHLTGIHPHFQRETAMFEKVATSFSQRVERLLVKHGKSIIQNEFLIRRFADIATDLFAVGCCLSRGTAIIERKGLAASATEISTVRAFCRKARRRLSENIRGLKRNDDALEVEIASSLYRTGGWKQHGYFLEP